MNRIVTLLVLLFLCSCGSAQYVDGAPLVAAKLCSNPDGFWSGLWHGLILPFNFLYSLFVDDGRIYSLCNNGGWYDLGFVIGASTTFGGSSSAQRRRYAGRGANTNL